ncbi:MAG: hypothetical protein V2I33_01420 [Kangiellaceae bacterium]|jgi:hypothetical protein|nr:hypothetical protein [Kangiellaceae bacterium]
MGLVIGIAGLPFFLLPTWLAIFGASKYKWRIAAINSPVAIAASYFLASSLGYLTGKGEPSHSHFYVPLLPLWLLCLYASMKTSGTAQK